MKKALRQSWLIKVAGRYEGIQKPENSFLDKTSINLYNLVKAASQEFKCNSELDN